MGPSREGEMTVDLGLLQNSGVKSLSDKWRGERVHRYLRTPLYVALSCVAQSLPITSPLAKSRPIQQIEQCNLTRIYRCIDLPNGSCLLCSLSSVVKPDSRVWPGTSAFKMPDKCWVVTCNGQEPHTLHEPTMTINLTLCPMDIVGACLTIGFVLQSWHVGSWHVGTIGMSDP